MFSEGHYTVFKKKLKQKGNKIFPGKGPLKSLDNVKKSVDKKKSKKPNKARYTQSRFDSDLINTPNKLKKARSYYPQKLRLSFPKATKAINKLDCTNASSHQPKLNSFLK